MNDDRRLRRLLTLPDEKDPEFSDYAADLEVKTNPLMRRVWAGLGLLSVGSAILGVILPGWPTVPFLLIAAFLFSRSSPRFYNLVLNHRVFGPIVRDYRAGNGIPRSIRLVAISSLVVFAGFSAFYLIGNQTVRLLVVAAATFGMGFLTGLPTRQPYGPELTGTDEEAGTQQTLQRVNGS